VMEITDANQQTVVSYRYDPYGKVTITRGGQTQSSDPLGQHWTFTGRFLDEESGLYYYLARYYDPVTGRFVSRDPAVHAAEASSFEYAADNPLSLRDPFGLQETGTVYFTYRTPSGFAQDVSNAGKPSEVESIWNNNSEVYTVSWRAWQYELQKWKDQGEKARKPAFGIIRGYSRPDWSDIERGVADDDIKVTAVFVVDYIVFEVTPLKDGESARSTCVRGHWEATATLALELPSRIPYVITEPNVGSILENWNNRLDRNHYTRFLKRVRAHEVAHGRNFARFYKTKLRHKFPVITKTGKDDDREVAIRKARNAVRNELHRILMGWHREWYNTDDTHEKPQYKGGIDFPPDAPKEK